MRKYLINKKSTLTNGKVHKETRGRGEWSGEQENKDDDVKEFLRWRNTRKPMSMRKIKIKRMMCMNIRAAYKYDITDSGPIAASCMHIRLTAS